MADTTVYYQENDNDCWLCALRNMLGILGIPVSEDQIREILLNKKGLALLSGRGFFTYLPEVLDFLHLACEFVLDSDDSLLSHIFSEQNRINIDQLKIIEQECFDNRNALYYYYKSLRSACGSPYVTIRFDEPVIREYLDQGYMVVACLEASELYGMKQNHVLHTVTIIKEREKIKVVDPYEQMGRFREKNWSEFSVFRDKKEWNEKVPYFIAVKANGREADAEGRLLELEC